jgi:hypothetical protein
MHHLEDNPECPLVADTVEKVALPLCREFFRALLAFDGRSSSWSPWHLVCPYRLNFIDSVITRLSIEYVKQGALPQAYGAIPEERLPSQQF